MIPTPVPEQVVCSVCSLPWENHGEEPQVDDCVRLLLAEVERLKLPIVGDWPMLPNLGWPTSPMVEWWRYPVTTTNTTTASLTIVPNDEPPEAIPA